MYRRYMDHAGANQGQDGGLPAASDPEALEALIAEADAAYICLPTGQAPSMSGGKDMAIKATCEACGKDNQDCLRLGNRFVCTRCQNIYNDVRTFVIEAKALGVIPVSIETNGS